MAPQIGTDDDAQNTTEKKQATDTSTGLDPEDPHARFWFAQEIGKIRAVSEPGGDAMTVDEALELRDQLDETIEEAKQVLEGAN